MFVISPGAHLSFVVADVVTESELRAEFDELYLIDKNNKKSQDITSNFFTHADIFKRDVLKV